MAGSLQYDTGRNPYQARIEIRGAENTRQSAEVNGQKRPCAIFSDARRAGAA